MHVVMGWAGWRRFDANARLDCILLADLEICLNESNESNGFLIRNMKGFSIKS